MNNHSLKNIFEDYLFSTSPSPLPSPICTYQKKGLFNEYFFFKYFKFVGFAKEEYYVCTL